MLYIPKNVEQKTSAKGTNYIVADFEDANGQIIEKVSTFDPIVEGRSVEGQITQNGQYMNFKVTKQFQSGGKTGQIEKVMEKKNESIANFQDAKEKSIQHAGAITNATNLTIAWINSRAVSHVALPLTEDQVKQKLRENIIFYQNLYKYPNDINPSSNESPDF